MTSQVGVGAGPARSEGFELHGEATSIRALVSSLWRSRELVRMLARRDFFVRYRRPAFGIAWALGVPLLHAVVIATIFSIVVKVHTEVPYAVFVLAGILPWTFFSVSVNAAATSIADGRGLASKVYFPRAILPLVAVGGNLYGFLPSTIPVLIAAVVLGAPISVNLLLLIPATVLLVVITSALGLVLGAIHVYFRDVGHIIAAIIPAWFYASAIFFPLDLVPEGIVRTLVHLNPVTGVVQLFRLAVAGNEADWVFSVISTIGWSAALLVVAALLYRRFDRVFVDLL